MQSSEQVSQRLCLACGLCCNGVLFKDVELQPGDDAAKLRASGLPVSVPRSAHRPARFPQPCAALGVDCRCRVYADRPSRCRAFECALFQSVQAGHTAAESALRTIKLTRQRADQVRRLMKALGDTDEHVALSIRFRRIKKRMESAAFDEAAGDLYGQLTLAVHDLNLLLGSAFYPQPG